MFLDNRLGPTLSCLVAEKKKSQITTFCHINKSLYLPSLFPYLPSSTFATSSFSNFDCSLLNPTFLNSSSPHSDLIIKLCCCGRKVVIWEFSFLYATNQDRGGPSLQSRYALFTFCSLMYILFNGTGSVD